MLICAAALGGGVVGAVAQHWLARQKLAQLQQRLVRSEEARNGAIERSVKAREQIALLSKSIADLRRAHQSARSISAQDTASSAEERRAMAERALAAAAEADGNDDGPSSSKPGAILFANTEPMEL